MLNPYRIEKYWMKFDFSLHVVFIPCILKQNLRISNIYIEYIHKSALYLPRDLYGETVSSKRLVFEIFAYWNR